MLRIALAFGFFAVLAAGLLARPSAPLLSSLTVALGALLLLVLLRARLVAALLLAFFLLYGLLPVWAMQVLGRVPLSNWRGQLFAPEALDGAVLYYCVGFAVFGLGTLAGQALGGWALPARGGRPPPPDARPFWPALVAFFLAMATAAAFFGVARDSWITTASIADRFVMQATTIATIAAFGFNLETLRRSRRPAGWLDYVPLIVAAAVALQGFRFMLVGALLTLLVARRDTLANSPTRVAQILVAALLAYGVLTAGMGVRALASARDVGVLTALGQLDAVYLSRFIGAPEQTGMLALKYFNETPMPPLMGRTYLDAIPRLLPNAVHSAFFDTLRPQDYILAQFAWVSSWFRAADLNIGAHLFVEAIINFGPRGGLWVALLAGFVVPWVDLLPARRDRLVPLLYGVATFAYAAAWYGSATFLKYTAYYVAVFAVLALLHRLRFT